MVGKAQLRIMLILCLLSVQFAVTYGDLTCLYQKYPKCYIPIIRRKDIDYCTGYPDTVKCIKADVAKCHVEETIEITDMETMLQDTCQKGTQLNAEYMKHKTCVFNYAMNLAKPCYTEFFSTLDESKSTGDIGKDEWMLFNVSCRYMNEAFQCVGSAVGRKCGTEAQDLYHKLFSPGNEITVRACLHNSAAAAHFSWLLLQAAAVVFILRYRVYIKISN